MHYFFPKEYLLKILEEMKKIQADMKILKQDIIILKSAMQLSSNDKKEFLGTVLQISEKYNINLPLSDLSEFQIFDNKLKCDESFKKDVVSFCNFIKLNYILL